MVVTTSVRSPTDISRTKYQVLSRLYVTVPLAWNVTFTFFWVSLQMLTCCKYLSNNHKLWNVQTWTCKAPSPQGSVSHVCKINRLDSTYQRSRTWCRLGLEFLPKHCKMQFLLLLSVAKNKKMRTFYYLQATVKRFNKFACSDKNIFNFNI